MEGLREWIVPPALETETNENAAPVASATGKPEASAAQKPETRPPFSLASLFSGLPGIGGGSGNGSSLPGGFGGLNKMLSEFVTQISQVLEKFMTNAGGLFRNGGGKPPQVASPPAAPAAAPPPQPASPARPAPTVAAAPQPAPVAKPNEPAAQAAAPVQPADDAEPPAAPDNVAAAPPNLDAAEVLSSFRTEGALSMRSSPDEALPEPAAAPQLKPAPGMSMA